MPDASNHHVVQSLVQASRKNTTGPLYTRYINRNAAIPLTYLFWKLGLHPNTVSLISFAITHLAFLLLVFLPTTPAVCVAAYLLLALGFVTDSCDGQLARVSGKTSKLGGWLDHSLDMLKLLNIHMVLGYVTLTLALQQDMRLEPIFIAIFLCLLSQPSHFYVTNLQSQLLGTGTGKATTASPPQRNPLLSLVGNGADYGLFIMIVLLLPWPTIFLPVYLAYGCFFMLLFLAYFARTLVRARRLERAEAEQVIPTASSQQA